MGVPKVSGSRHTRSLWTWSSDSTRVARPRGPWCSISTAPAWARAWRAARTRTRTHPPSPPPTSARRWRKPWTASTPARSAPASSAWRAPRNWPNPPWPRLFHEAWERAGLHCPMRVITDCEAAFATGTSSPSGTVLVAGTGSIAGRIVDHRMVGQSGGYGWLIGDDGSAFWLGREAVRATLKLLDLGRAAGRPGHRRPDRRGREEPGPADQRCQRACRRSRWRGSPRWSARPTTTATRKRWRSSAPPRGCSPTRPRPSVRRPTPHPSCWWAA